MKHTWLYLVSILLAASCMLPEKPIKPYDRGGISLVTVPLNSNYQYQVFFSLDSNKVIRRVNRMDWDLAFDCSDSHVILSNSGRGIYVAPTKVSDLNAVTDTAGLKFYWGQPSLDRDSLAFGTWWLGSPKVFVINMGYDLNGIPLGFMKCIPVLLPGNKLKITYATLESNTPQTLVIEKNKDLLFNSFSLLSGKMAEVEPPKNTWDFMFSQYVKLLFAPPYPATRNYEVVGVLGNTSRIEVGYEFSKPFASITSSGLPAQFYRTRDAIGFDWKWFEIGTNSYTVNPGMNYIIRTSEGFLYKMHFLDFYDDKGVKGFPKFEFQKL